MFRHSLFLVVVPYSMLLLENCLVHSPLFGGDVMSIVMSFGSHPLAESGCCLQYVEPRVLSWCAETPSVYHRHQTFSSPNGEDVF